MSVRVLVTGASGFLGGRIVRGLVAAGHAPCAMVRASSDRSGLHGIDCVIGDLDAPESLRRVVQGVEVIVHAAARVDDAGSYESFHRTNVTGTQALLRAARGAGVRRFVFVSSPSAVMTGQPQVNIDESVPYPRRFLHAYCETKALGEQAVLDADDPGGFRTIALRPRGIWGPGDRTGPIPRLLARMRSGRLPDLSGGKQVLVDLCYVDSAVHACVLAVQGGGGGRAFFVTDGRAIDVWQTARDLAMRFGLRPPSRGLPPAAAHIAARAFDGLYRVPPLRGRAPPLSRYGLALITRSHTYDISAARRELGYEPLCDWSEGLERYTAWIEDQGGIEAYLQAVPR